MRGALQEARKPMIYEGQSDAIMLLSWYAHKKCFGIPSTADEILELP